AAAYARLFLELRARGRGLQSGERRHVHADAERARHASAHGAGRLQAGAEAGLWRRACWLEAIHGKARWRIGARGGVSMSKFIRQFHRWVSIAFTLGVIVNTIVIATADGAEPATWVYLLALAPLFLLLASGLYLFMLPYVRQRSGA